MSKKNVAAIQVEKEVRQQEQNQAEITELSFEAMETISGGAAKVCWCVTR